MQNVKEILDLFDGEVPREYKQLIQNYLRGRDRYYRGPCKKLRKREEVVAKRKAQKQARKEQRKSSTRGQKRVKGQRFRMN